MGWTAHLDNHTSAWQLFSLSGAPSVTVADVVGLKWSPAGDAVSLSGSPVAEGRSYIIPLSAGEVLPRIPAGGLRTEEEIAQLPGARKVDAETVPGPVPGSYTFYRRTTQRNLYRIPIP
jgi:hypothetical protein